MLFDSHCHLNFDCFNHDRLALMDNLARAHINDIIIPGTDAKRWTDIIKLVEQNKAAQSSNNLYYSLGIHPHFLNDFESKQLILLKEILINETNKVDRKCIALGEIGLDTRIDIDISLQEKTFLAQLHMAQLLALPVILHVVKAQSRVLRLLKRSGFTYGGTYHAFSGSEEIANEFIKLGFKLGIGGVITHPAARKTRKAISKLPLSSLVIETDAPDMPIYQQQSKDNSPMNLRVIFDALCELRSEPADQIEQQLYLNTCLLFSINHD